MPASSSAAPVVRAAFAAASVAQATGSTPETADDVCVAYPDEPSAAASTTTVASVTRWLVSRPVVDATASSVVPLVKNPYEGVSPVAPIAAAASLACSAGPRAAVSSS